MDTQPPRICTSCGVEKPYEKFASNGRKGRRRICSSCFRKRKPKNDAYRARINRIALKKIKRPDVKLKRAAQAALNHEVRHGRITKQPCEVCGALKVDAHHDDYSKPLNVRWLCRPHHHEVHRLNGTMAPAVPMPKEAMNDR